MLIIRKQPSEKYLKNWTFCLTEAEFGIVHNPNIEAEIHIFDQEGGLVGVISRRDFELLNFTSKSPYGGDHYYIADANEVFAERKPVEFSLVEAVRKSVNDQGFTYKAADLSKWTINDGDEYLVEHACGAVIHVHANRDGSCLYSGKLTRSELKSIVMPEVKAPAKHKIVAIYKKLKQRIA
jgi:hypothetical protein